MSSSNQFLEKISNYLFVIFIIVLTVIGIIGNSFAIYILTRPKFIKLPIFRYFFATEVVASMSLVSMWTWNAVVWLNWNVTDYFCKFFEYLLHTGYDLYPWINVVNSLDRLMSVKFPNKYLFRNKLKYQLLAIAAILIASILVNIPSFLHYETSNVSVCGIADDFIGIQIFSANLIISNIAPLLIMILTSSLTTYYLIKEKKKIRQESNRKSFIRELKFFKCVVSVDLWFFICYLPWSILNLLKYVFRSQNKVYDFWRVLQAFCVILVMVQTTCNFFVYYIFNKSFKNYFYTIISPHFDKLIVLKIKVATFFKKTNQVAPQCTNF